MSSHTVYGFGNSWGEAPIAGLLLRFRRNWVDMDKKIFLVLCGLFFFGLLPQEVQAQPSPSFDVIIDVGHGGVDGGTSSTNNILEKDINLAIG